MFHTLNYLCISKVVLFTKIHTGCKDNKKILLPQVILEKYILFASNHRLERWHEHRNQERLGIEGQGKRSSDCGRQ